ncbi:unnamed protein product [Ectocarpus sp. 12 AP-2014]
MVVSPVAVIRHGRLSRCSLAPSGFPSLSLSTPDGATRPASTVGAGAGAGASVRSTMVIGRCSSPTASKARARFSPGSAPGVSRRGSSADGGDGATADVAEPVAAAAAAVAAGGEGAGDICLRTSRSGGRSVAASSCVLFGLLLPHP